MDTRRRTWGMTQEEWAAAVDRLHALLRQAARERSTVTYGEAARRAFQGRFSARSGALMDLLAEVDEATSSACGVMYAALVVRADTGMPGDGYFAFAERLEGAPIPDRRQYWQRQVGLVWDEATR